VRSETLDGAFALPEPPAMEEDVWELKRGCDGEDEERELVELDEGSYCRLEKYTHDGGGRGTTAEKLPALPPLEDPVQRLRRDAAFGGGSSFIASPWGSRCGPEGDSSGPENTWFGLRASRFKISSECSH